LNIGTQELIIIVGLAIGITWYLSKCSTQHYIKFHIRWWVDHQLDRWLCNRIDECEKWNKNMTKTKWYILSIGFLSIVFIPIIVWNLLLPEIDKGLYYSVTVSLLIVEYLSLLFSKHLSHIFCSDLRCPPQLKQFCILLRYTTVFKNSVSGMNL